ncbi:MAG: PHB depolymerase family esterase [Bdellovibrionales bacterium]|nr:PHB depolymerase family esterase [Bdellovibrionales bacterium]
MTTTKTKYFLVILIGFGVIFSIYGEAPPPALPHPVSVSGVSSGGIMAQHLAATHPDRINGVGLFVSGIIQQTAGVSATPWDPLAALFGFNHNACKALLSMKVGVEDHEAVLRAIRQILDQTAGGSELFKNIRFFVVSGKADQVLHASLHSSLLDVLSQLGVPQNNIFAHVVPNMGHAMPIRITPGAVLGEKDFLHPGDFDGVGTMFKFFLNPSASNHLLNANLEVLASEFLILNQQDFVPTGLTAKSISMGTEAYIYIPKACRENKNNCQKIHVALHGCEQTIEKISRRFMTATGYLKWAEAFNVVVIFPQVVKSHSNPMGCWDWWGYTGQNYATKNAPQIQTIMNMVDFVQKKLMSNDGTLSP